MIALFQYSFCAVISAARNSATYLRSQTSKLTLVDSGAAHGSLVLLFQCFGGVSLENQ